MSLRLQVPLSNHPDPYVILTMSNSRLPSSFSRRPVGLLACAPLLLGLAAGTVRAGSSSPTGGGESGFTRRPFTLTADTRFGYDDNTLDESSNKHDSAFINADVNAAYTARNTRTTLAVSASTGFTYYFDRPGREYDPNVGLSLALTYKLTPRATLAISNFSVYQAEPDLGTVGFQERRNGDYFYTSNNFALSYRFTPRLSTVTSYSPNFFVYREQPYSFYQDRAEHYFGQSLRFLVQPRLTLVGEYRFGYVQYFNDRDASIQLRTVQGFAQPQSVFIPDYHSDSYSHFILAGFDYALGPRFRATLRAGVQVRTYVDEDTLQVTNGVTGTSVDRITDGTVLGPNSRITRFTRGTEASPYVEGSLAYDLNRRGNLSLTTRYGIEEGNLAISDSSRDSFRIGLTYNQGITARLGGYVGFNYNYSSYSNADAGNNFSDNVYDVSVGLRYVLNRHVALEVGYTHTTVSSDFGGSGTTNVNGVTSVNDFNGREYDRNRYFVGARFAF